MTRCKSTALDGRIRCEREIGHRGLHYFAGPLHSIWEWGEAPRGPTPQIRKRVKR